MFKSLLMAYYLCDAAAASAVLDYTSVIRCNAVYTALKAEFLSPGERAALAADPLGFGGEAGRAAYRRFTAWEAGHVAQVAALKAEARATVRGQPGS